MKRPSARTVQSASCRISAMGTGSESATGAKPLEATPRRRDTTSAPFAGSRPSAEPGQGLREARGASALRGGAPAARAGRCGLRSAGRRTIAVSRSPRHSNLCWRCPPAPRSTCAPAASPGATSAPPLRLSAWRSSAPRHRPARHSVAAAQPTHHSLRLALDLEPRCTREEAASAPTPARRAWAGAAQPNRGHAVAVGHRPKAVLQTSAAVARACDARMVHALPRRALRRRR